VVALSGPSRPLIPIELFSTGAFHRHVSLGSKSSAARGFIVCWLFADEALARAAFLKRSPNDISSFEEQKQLIRAAELPNGLDAINVEALNSSGFRPWSEMRQEIQNAWS
jgi:hypothetical protein